MMDPPIENKANKKRKRNYQYHYQPALTRRNPETKSQTRKLSRLRLRTPRTPPIKNKENQTRKRKKNGLAQYRVNLG